MTPMELKLELERLAEKATPGPFIVSTCASPEESKGQVTLDALRSGGMGEVVYRYAWIKNRADCDLDALYRNNHNLILRALSALSACEGAMVALEKAESADQIHINCEHCEGEEVPEKCGECWPHFDDARLTRRSALAQLQKVMG